MEQFDPVLAAYERGGSDRKAMERLMDSRSRNKASEAKMAMMQRWAERQLRRGPTRARRLVLATLLLAACAALVVLLVVPEKTFESLGALVVVGLLCGVLLIRAAFALIFERRR